MSRNVYELMAYNYKKSTNSLTFVPRNAVYLRIYLRALYVLVQNECRYERYEVFSQEMRTKSIEELELEYEDEKNSMIAITEPDDIIYDEFYDEVENRIKFENSMDMLYFGPSSTFLRLDSETVLHILTNTIKHSLPISRAILAWDIITDGKTAAFLQGRELSAFDSLLNVVPEEDLYYVNFGDPSVFKYFAKQYIELSNRKYGVIAAAYRRYFGNDWHTNGAHINELGYLLCAFPASDLKRITPTVFKELTYEVLNKLDRCNVDQKRTLYNIATHHDAYGEPYKWSSHEIGRLDTLFTSIPRRQISSIKLEAIRAIKANVMKLINQKKLEYFTKQQILSMNIKTRRIFILRMQLKNSLDTKQISRRNKGCCNLESNYKIMLISIITLVFLSQIIKMEI